MAGASTGHCISPCLFCFHGTLKLILRSRSTILFSFPHCKFDLHQIFEPCLVPTLHVIQLQAMAKKFTITKSTITEAVPSVIFKVLTEVEHWHFWTASVKKITLINSNILEKGSRAKVVQPKLPSAVWKVTDIEKNTSFTWVSQSPGIKITAAHLIEVTPAGTRITLTTVYEGILAGLIYKLTAAVTDTYMQMEINGLKQECEKHMQGVYM